MNTVTRKAVNAQLQDAQSIAIIPHKNPDGDALGSCLALYLYLQAKGHEVNIVSPNDYPDFLKWLPQQEEIIIQEAAPEKATEVLSKADLIFTLDFNHFSRTGALAEVLEKSTANFIMIDHHQEPADYATMMLSDVTCSSTCELVYRFFDILEDTQAITPAIATCLYVGIMTDTGSFRFPLTTSTTHRVLADLIDKGAQNAAIHQQTFDTNSYNRMQLMGVALNNLKLIPEANTAYISLSQAELDAHHFKKGDTEGFVNFGLSIKGIIFAAIFIEHKAENIIKISLRSKGDFNVNQLARRYFNGGGHNNAAGGRSEKSLTETIAYFEEIVAQHQNELTHEK